MNNIWGKGGLFEQRINQKMQLADREANRDDLLADSQIGYREDVGTATLGNAETNRLNIMDGDYSDMDLGGLSRLGQGNSPSTIFGKNGNNIGIRGSSVASGRSGLRNFGSNKVSAPGRMREREGGYVGETPDLVGFRKGGKVPCFNQGGPVKIPGYEEMKRMKVTMPGPIGDVEDDTGKDTVNAKVREGEYLLNPESVAAFGGGDYEKGVRSLNNFVEGATGVQPGAEYDEDGTMYAADSTWIPWRKQPRGATSTGNPQMHQVETRPANPNARINPEMGPPRETLRSAGDPKVRARAYNEGTDYAKQQAERATDGVGKPKAKPAPQPKAAKVAKAPSGVRAAISGKHTTTVGDVARGVKTAATKAHPLKNAGKAARGGLPLSAMFGAVQGYNTDTADYAERFSMDPPESMAGELALRGVGVMSDVGTSILDGLSLPYNVVKHGADFDNWHSFRNNFHDVQNDRTAAEAAVAGAPAGAAPATGATVDQNGRIIEELPEVPPTLRSFSAPDWMGSTYTEGLGSDESTRIANYLVDNGQNAGPDVNAGNLRDIPGAPGTQYAGRYGGQEVLATTGKHGEPSFTGLRTPQQVAESTARSVQEQKPLTNEQRLQNEYDKLASMPRKTPSQRQTMERLGTNLASMENTRANVLAAAVKAGDSSLEGMRDAYTSTGLFTNPETGKVDDAQYFEFVDSVGAQLAKEDIEINELPPEAMMVLASEYSMARGTTNKFNRIVQGETDYRPSGLLRPQDVPASRPAEFFRDIGWGDPGSNVGFFDALRGAPVHDVNIPGTGGDTMTVTSDDLGFRDLARKNYYEGR